MESMAGKWDYSGVSEVCYSDVKQESYKKAAAFFGDLPVEDWGGGTGWVRRYIKGKYRNIDGSPHPNVDEVVDLAVYKSNGYNILIRQVLGCAGDVWKKIVINALKSFDKKLCIIVSTPFVSKTREGNLEPVVLSDGTIVKNSYIKENYFSKQEILDFFAQDYIISYETIPTEQYYHSDWVLYVEKI